MDATIADSRRLSDNLGMIHNTLAALVPLLLLLASAPADACDCRVKALSDAIRTDYPFIFEGQVVERSLHTTRTTSGGGTGEVEPLGRDVVKGSLDDLDDLSLEDEGIVRPDR